VGAVRDSAADGRSEPEGKGRAGIELKSQRYCAAAEAAAA
jgi:hypothetical protein